ncbi:MAG: outer membrane beta-barrel protein [Gammaproteobacteria bacterium]|nr:outer membrane beta-barrel protein [Gammaproteobacteria bacterium]NND47665.1 OmpW family protein [Woeseiaceae bacterium]
MKTRNYFLVAASLLALAAAPALAYEEGAWILRGGVGTVQPKSNGLTISDEDFGSVIFDVDDATNMTLNATYMFTRHWAFDVLAALPFEHDIYATLDFDSVSEKVKIAETKQIPATFSVQYHFLPDNAFQPYAGLGFNWTTFSSTRFVSLPSSMFEGSEIEYEEFGGLKIDDSFGLALQVGGDWNIGERMVLNFDVRWFDIDADTYYLDPSISGEEKLGSMKVDPFLYALNLGFHF